MPVNFFSQRRAKADTGQPADGSKPERLLFYVIAQAGEQGRQLPVAIASCSSAEYSGRSLIQVCLRLRDIFSAPSNRFPIQSELGLARHFYQNAKLPFGDERGVEFAIISACLLAGLQADCHGETPSIKLQPIARVGGSHIEATGNVVLIDISMLQDVAVGIGDGITDKAALMSLETHAHRHNFIGACRDLLLHMISVKASHTGPSNNTFDVEAKLVRDLSFDPKFVESPTYLCKFLRFAYADMLDLNWTRLGSLSYEGVAKALESTQLSQAQNVSICIDKMIGSPGPFLHALCYHENIGHVCFAQDPCGRDENAGTEIWRQIQTHPQYERLRQKRLTFSSSFSAALYTRNWPPPELPLPANLLPSVQLFVYSQALPFGDSSRPQYVHVKDRFYGPHSFAAAFRTYLQEASPDRSFASFSLGPTSLGNWANDRVLHFSSQISPSVSGLMKKMGRKSPPKLQTMYAGEWALVVSSELPCTLVGRGKQSPSVQYTFLRVLKDVVIQRNVLFSEDAMAVHTLSSFLHEAADKADVSAIETSMNKTAEIMRSKRHAQDPVTDDRILSVLSSDSARMFLRETLLQENSKGQLANTQAPRERIGTHSSLSCNSDFSLTCADI